MAASALAELEGQLSAGEIVQTGVPATDYATVRERTQRLRERLGISAVRCRRRDDHVERAGRAVGHAGGSAGSPARGGEVAYMYVIARHGEPFEELYRRFKRGMEASGILREARRKRRFIPNHELRRDKRRRAEQRARKRAA